MKYNQPYDQPASPNAPYIDGNPSAGIQGSIVPAAAIEYPQRELVALFQAAGITPTNSDLAQLIKALKVVDVYNIFKVGTNGGNASQWSMACPPLPVMPPPPGTAVWFKPGYPSVNGGTVFSINGSPFKPVTNPDLSPISQGDIIATGWLLLFFDGAEWQVIAGGSTRQTGALPILQANAHWYVNGSTGDDVNNDGTTPTFTAGTKHGPFKTIQRAVNETSKYNMNGYDQYIHVADGAYAPVFMPTTNGVGWVRIYGNFDHPENCTVTSTANETLAMIQGGGSYDVRGFRLSATGTGTCDGIGVNSGRMVISNLRFGPCTRFHMSAAWNATLTLDGGTNWIESGANTQAHIAPHLTSAISINPYNWPNLVILGPVNIPNGHVWAMQLGVGDIIYNSISGYGFEHGVKFYIVGNGIVSCFSQPESYLPGDSPGVKATGGQYV